MFDAFFFLLSYAHCSTCSIVSSSFLHNGHDSCSSFFYNSFSRPFSVILFSPFIILIALGFCYFLPPHKIFLILSCCHCFCCYCIYSCFFADWISSPMTCLLNICSICCPLTNWFFYSIVFCFYKWGFSSNFDPFIPW